jgi:hypothetical protein
MAEAAVALTELLLTTAASVGKTIADDIDDDHRREKLFTTTTRDRLMATWPNMNAMIVHPRHQRQFIDEVHVHWELDISHTTLGITTKRTQGYEAYIFKSGTFTL